MNKGKITTTRPIPLRYVGAIKKLLKDEPRDRAWFTLSTNSAFRGGDILRIKKSDLRELRNGQMEIEIREKKTNKLRTVTVNHEVAGIVKSWLAVHTGLTQYLFEGTKGKMGTAWWSVKLKEWCLAVGFNEPRIATHSCRKTFVRVNYERGAKLVTIMHALKHDSERTTLAYMGIMAEDEAKLYETTI